jgi:chaperone BCS1
MPTPSSPASPAMTQLSSLFSDALSGLSTASSRSGSLSPLTSPTPTGSHSHCSESISSRTPTKSEMSKVPSVVEEHVAACAQVVPPLSAACLAELAKELADSILDEGFSVAALQGSSHSPSLRRCAFGIGSRWFASGEGPQRFRVSKSS